MNPSVHTYSIIVVVAFLLGVALAAGGIGVAFPADPRPQEYACIAYGYGTDGQHETACYKVAP